MYEPPKPYVPDVPIPDRYRPLPDNGDYVYPTSTGMLEGYPIGMAYVPNASLVSEPDVREPAVVDLFSDEAKSRRRLKQAYAESAFRRNAQSKAGAKGLFQIMDITHKDYLGRGRGKAGDIYDPEYNGQIRDWVMGIIPRDLNEFWSDDDSDRNKLAKLYAAYNWGAGNLRGYLRKKQKAGVDISNPDNWVEGLNPETRRYVKYLAFDEDIPDSIYTNSAFEEAARKSGYMAEVGRLYGDGGDKKADRNPIRNMLIQNWFNKKIQPKIDELGMDGVRKRLYDNVNPVGYHDAKRRVENALNGVSSEHNDPAGVMRDDIWATYLSIPKEQRHALRPYRVELSPYAPTVGDDVNSVYYKLDSYPIWKKDEIVNEAFGIVGDRVNKPIGIGDSVNSGVLSEFFGTHTLGRGVDPSRGDYISYYDLWDIAPVGSRGVKDQSRGIGNPLEFYDRIYLDDYYGVNSRPQNSDEFYGGYITPTTITANKEASGGKIRIKPENRGKFTALKKRTGHSASWFKAHGTPAQKKMAVFELNARKWKHGDGGLINTFDMGGDEKQPWWKLPVRVPNMTGTATAAATGLRDIPLTDSTVGRELGVAATGLASIAGPAAINWLANPANQILAGKFLTPLAGMGLTNAAINKYTPWSSWGDAIYNMPMLGGGRSVSDYVDMYPHDREIAANPKWYDIPVGALVKEGIEWTNPAFFAPYEGIAKGTINLDRKIADRVSGWYDRARGYIKDIRKPGIEVPYEPSEAFAVDLGPQSVPKTEYVETTASIEPEPRLRSSMREEPTLFNGRGEVSVDPEFDWDALDRSVAEAQVAHQNTEPEVHYIDGRPYMRGADILERIRRRELALQGIVENAHQPATEAAPNNFLNERAQTLLRNIEDANRRTADALSQTRDIMSRSQRSPITELSEDELNGIILSDRVGNRTGYSHAEIEAEQARRLGEARNMDFSNMSTDELREMRRTMNWNDSRHDAVTDALRNRVRSEYGIISSLDDVSRMTDEQLASLSGNYNLGDLNVGLSSGSSEYINTGTLRSSVDREIRSRVSHLNVPSSFGSLDEAAGMYSMINKAGWNFRDKADAVMKAIAPDLKRAIVLGEDIPSAFDGRIDGLIEQMIDSNRIDPGNRWFDYWASRRADDYSSMSVRSLKNTLENIVGGAKDESKEAIRKLRNSTVLKRKAIDPDGNEYLADRSLDELLDMVKNPGALPEAQKNEVERIIKSAYGKPEPMFSSPSRSRKIKNEIVEKAIRNRLPESVRDKFSLGLMGDPYMDGYPEVAKAVRDDLGFQRLPGDIEHLYWFDVSEARKHGLNERDAKTMVALKSELLQRGMPRQTAIAEESRSPQSLLNSYKGAVRSPGGYGTQPGQTSIVELPYSELEYGNDLHTRRVKFDSSGNMVIGENTEGAAENFFTKDKMDEFVNALEANGRDIEATLRSNPEFIELTDKLIRLSRAMNYSDSQPISAAVRNINRRFGDKLSEPALDIFARTSDTPGFWTAKNMSDVKDVWRKFIRDLTPDGAGDVRGYATYLHRVPTITLKHKYGGLLSKHSPDNIKSAILKVKAGRK